MSRYLPPHGDHVARLRHLVIDLQNRDISDRFPLASSTCSHVQGIHCSLYLSKSRSHFVRQGAGHNHDISLPGTSSKHHPKAVHVVAGSRHVHHLHSAARQAKRHRPQGALQQERHGLWVRTLKAGPETLDG